ncbi:MAG: response regulator [Pseudomonadota bacterium]
MTSIDHQTQTVLVIDDNQDVRSLMGHLLESLDCAALLCASGAEGLTQLQASPDINQVVVDLNMPDMDGWTCLQKIRTTHPSIPVVVCSGYHYADQPDLTPLAPVRYLQKPYSIDDFRNALNLPPV